MSELADQLKDILGNPGGEPLNTLDLMSLPPSVRRIFNLMLRKVEIPYTDLCQIVAEFPENKRLSQSELDEVIEALCRIGWLEQEQKAGVVAYKISLKTPPGLD
ncbi:MAG: hypothetical protein JXB07_04005 [Anaerolineae bacterium]|nr:hypothetical protein [Anaerolineae bacterium]